MTSKHEHIDLTTLKEVERLLTSTDVNTFGDINQRSGMTSSTEAPPVSAEAFAPLPSRRS